MVSMASENTFQTYLFCFDNSYKKDNYKPSESNTHTHTHKRICGRDKWKKNQQNM